LRLFQSRLPRSCWDLHQDNLNKSRQSRLFETINIIWDLSRLFKIYWDISTLSRLFEGLQVQKSWQIEKSWSRKKTISSHYQSRSRQTVKIDKKFHVWIDFLISIKAFGTGRWWWDKIKTYWSRSGFSRLSAQAFQNQRDQDKS
jgi:hypothetical protein